VVAQHTHGLLLVVCACDVQLASLLSSCKSPDALASYISTYGPGCLPLVRLLLEKGADPNAVLGPKAVPFTALHIVSCWAGGKWREYLLGLLPAYLL
jgi:hypothetical protein